MPIFKSDKQALFVVIDCLRLDQWRVLEPLLTGMFDVDPASRQARMAQAAYRTYADQVKEAFRRGLTGQKTTAADLHGNCGAILDAKP